MGYSSGTIGARRGRLGLLLPPLLMLAACGAGYTAVAQRQLDVQTRMSSSIFLDPLAATRRTVWIEVRNTSDKPGLDVDRSIRDLIMARGWRIVDDPQVAEVRLQAVVLQAGRNARTAAQSAFEGGFGSILVGAAAGGGAGYGVGSAGGNDVAWTLGGALAGAAVGGVADAFVQKVDYSVITDVQLSQRAGPGVIVTRVEDARLQQGSAGALSERSSESGDWRRYRTRVVSTAAQVNLDWPDAEPALTDGLSRSVAGLL